MSLREVLEALVTSEPFERLLLERARPIVARADAGQDFLLAGLAVALDAPVMVVTPGPREAEELASEIGAYLGPAAVALLPAWDALPYEGMDPAPEVAARRADALGRLRAARGPFVLVAPYLAAMQVVPPTLGTVAPLQLAAGVELAPDALAERLSELGYVRVDVVEHRGEFAVRGGVVDVFPGIARRPARLEYWGDEIERLREFSPSTQLSTREVGAIEIAPVRELFPDDELRSVAARRASDLPDRFRDGLQRLADGLRFEDPTRSRRSCSNACRRRESCFRPAPGSRSRRRSARCNAPRRRTPRPRRSPRRSNGRARGCSRRSRTRSRVTCSSV